MITFSIVIATHNDALYLRELLPSLRALDGRPEIIVCDGNSTDGTPDIASELGARVIHGYAGTVGQRVAKGLRYATRDFIVVLDVNLSFPPEFPSRFIERMVEALVEHDMVVASRYHSGLNQDTYWRVLSSWAGYMAALPLAPGISDRMTETWGIRKEVAKRVTDVDPRRKPFLEYYVKAKPSSVGEVGYIFRPRENRFGSPLQVLRDIGHAYACKFNKFLKFCLVGSTGAAIHIGVLLFFTEVIGWWYGVSAVFAIAVAVTWNFSLNNVWTFGTWRSGWDIWNFGRCRQDPDYEWWEWYGGHPVKRGIKRGIAECAVELVGGPDLVGDERILILGCGSSPDINLYNCIRVGVDHNPQKVEFLRRHTTATVLRRDITIVGLSLNQGRDMPDGLPQKYDIILCNQVVGDMSRAEINGVIKNIGAYLADNGKAIISMPDATGRIGKRIERFTKGKFYSPITIQTVKELMRLQGLEEVASQRYAWTKIMRFERRPLP